MSARLVWRKLIALVALFAVLPFTADLTRSVILFAEIGSFTHTCVGDEGSGSRDGDHCHCAHCDCDCFFSCDCGLLLAREAIGWAPLRRPPALAALPVPCPPPGRQADPPPVPPPMV